jgi:Asp-tRNA(Asn)/Glu-tRNA(Gln) amidotransferase C subunit
MSLTRRESRRSPPGAFVLTEQEMPVYVTSLSRIVALVGELSRADTGAVEPMAHPLPGQLSALRADVVTETDQHGSTRRTRRRFKPACTWCRE